MRTLLLIVLVFGLVMVIGGCGGGDGDGGDADEPAASGDAAAGEALFKQTTIGSQPGCITCHSLEPDTVLVGPSMAGIADRAGSRVSGQSAEAYLHESILQPSAHVVEGFSEGVMPAGLADELSDQQVDDLIAYLLTLH